MAKLTNRVTGSLSPIAREGWGTRAPKNMGTSPSSLLRVSESYKEPTDLAEVLERTVVTTFMFVHPAFLWE